VTSREGEREEGEEDEGKEEKKSRRTGAAPFAFRSSLTPSLPDGAITLTSVSRFSSSEKWRL
jgi:hypothetical protein